MSVLSLRLFANLPFAADAHGVQVPIGNRVTEGLAVALALKTGGAGLEELALLLFDNPGAVANVHIVIADLRAALRGLPQDVVVEDAGRLGFDPAAVKVDAREFDAMLGAPSMNSVRKATALYQANLLESFTTGAASFDAWLASQRLAYSRAAMLVFGNLLTAQIRAGWWEEAVDTAGRLLSLDPSQEVVHRTLIRLQLEQGRPDAALRRYEECAELLRREYGREPGAETKRLHEEIVRTLEKHPAPREAVLVPAGGPRLVLLVEDDLVSSALVEGYLEEAGFEVIAVRDGGDALLELGRRQFDLLVLDINVPTLSGLRVFEIMLQKQLATPALFITGSAGTDVEMQSLEMGAAGFLRKPIRKEVLLPKIRGILQRRQTQSAAGG